MKKSLIFLNIAFACLLASCNKNTEELVINEESLPDAPPTYICARNGEATPDLKSSIDGTTGAFTWSTGDQIALFSDSWQISSALADTYDATNDATFEFPAGINSARADFAVFPASLVFEGTSVRSGSATDHTSSALTITLPGSYTLDQVQDDEISTPMIATNAPDGELAFKQIGAMLRFVLNNVPKQTRSIAFDFNGVKVQGEFTLYSVEPGESVVDVAETEGDDDIITVLTPDIDSFASDLVINVPVPVGTFNDVTVTTYDENYNKINALTLPVKKSASWTASRKSFGKRTVNLPVFT